MRFYVYLAGREVVLLFVIVAGVRVYDFLYHSCFCLTCWLWVSLKTPS